MVLGLIQWRAINGLAAKNVADQRDGSGTRLAKHCSGRCEREVVIVVGVNGALKTARFIRHGEVLIVDAIGEGEVAGDFPAICGIDLGLIVR